MRLFADQDGKVAPSPCYFRVSDFDNVLEAEPNNDVNKATRYDGELPIAFNGVISEDKDYDWFRFKAKKGQVLDCRVLARQLRSPLDPYFVICNAGGSGLAGLIWVLPVAAVVIAVAALAVAFRRWRVVGDRRVASDEDRVLVERARHGT